VVICWFRQNVLGSFANFERRNIRRRF
jgi:hypothetical protein